MRYSIKQLKAILNQIRTSSDTIQILQYSGGSIKVEYKDNSLGFPVDSSVEIKAIDD